ncbi:PspC domain-containing protein [Pseudonocardia petroleophila]|uniref:PspC domain-containing protein n=1 Tax=Pseudonocardia petroleophila TaxID=37331 RepID=A0A7G7MPC6_9PSEU|nr:PspC domain-containing protein [Pseudonocardia petroleophila]QNG54637.1 PspC domain-containing protein [Pseudonocardia petroleophila]
MDGTELRTSLRDMWDTRPARPREGRQVAGVAAGIARRYDVDPVLIRVAFVVAAFSGVGVLLYVAGWIALPDGTDAPVSRGGPRGAALVGLAVVGAIGVGSLFDGQGFGILPLVVALGLLFLLHRSRGDRAPVTAAPVAAPVEEPGTVSLVKGDAPPAWDPLGAAPFAWDLPEPGGPPPVPERRRPPVTAVTLGVALLAGGATALLMLALGVLTLANTPVLLGVVLAVLGLGLVVGSFLRAGRGLVPVAVLVGLLTWGSLATASFDWPAGGVGDLVANPTTPAQLAPVYTRSAGDVDLDLSGLDLSGPGDPVRTEVRLGAGDVTITVPADADLTLTGALGVGSIRYGEEVRDGLDVRLDVSDLGADGVAGGRPLEIAVNANAGDVEVLRG